MAQRWPRGGLLLLLFAPPLLASNAVVFIEPDFPGAPSSTNLTRVAAVCAAQGGVAFDALSLKIWASPYSPMDPSSQLPPPDAAAVAFLHSARRAAPRALKIYGGIDVCPGPAYTCMLNYTLSALTGRQLAAAAGAAGLDGVQLYASPYCNNADCKRTTGKYAQGIAAIIAAARAAAPALDVVLLANEWDHVEIIAAAAPLAVFSYQTVFYFTSIQDCVAAAGPRCGAGENVAYTQRARQNFTAVLDYLDQHRVAFLGQLKGASTPEADNPPDFWRALVGYRGAAGSQTEVSAPAAL